MTIVRRLWRAAKYGVAGIASLGGLACVAFVAGGFVWGIAKGMLNNNMYNTWLQRSGWSGARQQCVVPLGV